MNQHERNQPENLGISPELHEDEVIIHISPSYQPCDHQWPDDSEGQTDMAGCCIKCGMSFQRYIHTEMP